jgi:endonuclease-8
MPEGPSIVILKEETVQFKGKKVLEVSGNTKQLELEDIEGKKLIDIKSWGKHYLLAFSGFSLRIHFMLFGSYRVNETKETAPRLHLRFSNGELNFYSCSIKRIDEPLDKVYDWSADVMNDNWDAKKAIEKLKKHPDMLVCDALLDQNIFSGVGNIIKNEVLFRIHVHPLSKVGKLPAAKLREMVKEAVHYSFQFLEWKKEYTLKKHWLAHTKTTCPRDHIPFKKTYPGKTKRRTYFCTKCQVLYT